MHGLGLRHSLRSLRVPRGVWMCIHVRLTHVRWNHVWLTHVRSLTHARLCVDIGLLLLLLLLLLWLLWLLLLMVMGVRVGIVIWRRRHRAWWRAHTIWNRIDSACKIWVQECVCC